MVRCGFRGCRRFFWICVVEFWKYSTGRLFVCSAEHKSDGDDDGLWVWEVSDGGGRNTSARVEI